MTDAETLPVYLEIQQTLEQAIRSGKWSPGHRVPSEHELMAQFGCARMTVNKALSQLANAGLIVRRRRAGSFVAGRRIEETVLEIHDIQAEVEAAGKTHSHAILSRSRRAATKADAARLGVQAGAAVLALTCRHDADGTPYVFEDRLLNLAAVPMAADEDFVAMPPGSWLLARIPWTDAEHQIRAVNAEAGVARKLGIASGAACLVIDRRTWQNGDPVTQVTLTYPGDRHALIARFNPGR